MFCDSAQPAEASVNTAMPAEHHRPPAEAVRQRAVEQVHEGEAEQVGRQRLLHLHRRRAQRLGDAGEGRQVGVDRERPQHAEQASSTARAQRGACQIVVGVRIHGRRKSVKRADRPDSVQRRTLRCRRRGRHSSGPGIAARLGATYPPARAEPHFEAGGRSRARAGLFGIAARRDCPFHPERLSTGPTRLCCSDPHLAVDSR